MKDPHDTSPQRGRTLLCIAATGPRLTYRAFLRAMLRHPETRRGLLVDFRQHLRRTAVVMIPFAIAWPLLKIDNFPWGGLLILAGLMFAHRLFRLQRTVAAAWREAAALRPDQAG